MFVFQVSINTKSIGLVVSNRFQLVRFFYAPPRGKKNNYFPLPPNFWDALPHLFHQKHVISGLLATSATTTEPKHIAKEIYGFPKDARKVTFALEVSGESVVNHGELVVFFLSWLQTDSTPQTIYIVEL
jgi:hypothetical protein